MNVLIDQSIPYDDRRECAWQHKQQLDSLPTFSSRLQYFLKNVSSYPSAILFMEGESAPFTVGVEAITDDDRRELHRAMMDHHRNELFQNRVVINHFADDKKVAFCVRPFEDWKANLESRLSSATRKEDILLKELNCITRDIDAAGRSVVNTLGNIHSSIWGGVIEELREYLERNIPYDFAFTNEYYQSAKALKLAQVWDIVHYESYLKDELAQLRGGEISDKTLDFIVSPMGDNGHRSPPTKLDYHSFAELFQNPDDISKWVDILRTVTRKNRKPVLDDSGNWIGKRGSISTLIAWVEVLQERGKFREGVTNTKMAALLNGHFPNLTLDVIDASIWRKFTPTRNRYHVEFLRLIR